MPCVYTYAVHVYDAYPRFPALSPSKAGKPMFKELDGSTAGSTSGGTEVQVTEVQVTEPKV